jgi:type I restriction enzyme M protein
MAQAAEEGQEYKSAGENSENDDESVQAGNITQPENLEELFPGGQYRDIPGLCKVATIEEISAQGWSLNPGRYVGVAEREEDEVDFKVRLEELNEELETLNSESEKIEGEISKNIIGILNKDA